MIEGQVNRGGTPMLTTAELAHHLGTDERTTRRFLRAIHAPHDAHQRWRIKEEEVDWYRLLFLLRKVGKTRAIEALDTALHRDSMNA
jgi:hypothetical protein